MAKDILNTKITKDRMVSLDVLRGMTIAFMIVVNNPGSWDFVYSPLEHAKWDGCTPTDLVFPFFVTIIGISMAISRSNSNETIGELIPIIKRSMIIFAIGVLLNWFPFYTKNIHDLRVLGVLQRIAMAYFFAGLILHFIKTKYALWIAGILVMVYSLILIYGGHSLENNLPNKVDLMFLGQNHIYKGYGIPFDPEGIIGTLGTAINVIIGGWVGWKLKSKPLNMERANFSLATGILLVGIAWLCSFLLPFNKPLWSPGYALFTSGICLVFLGAFIYLIDVVNVKKPFEFFRIYGMNALAAFVLSGLIMRIMMLIKSGDKNVYRWMYDGFYSPVFGDYPGSTVQAICYSIFIWLFAYAMHRNKFYWRV